ncbi:MAG: hypothetical protein M3Q99_16685, partial [Acidobacteriota bacterium]|nr:hypothetical protein [Acidobacteriota bacterium]
PDGILPSETVGINSSFGYTRRQDGSATAAKMAALQLFRHALRSFISPFPGRKEIKQQFSNNRKTNQGE